MLKIDRRNPDDARFVIEGLIPSARDRARWLGLLADAIEAAHAIHPASWAVTLFDQGLRLNVGRIETVVFGRTCAMLVLDSGQFTDDELDEIRLRHGPGAIDVYASVRGTVNCWLPYETDDAMLAEFRGALLPLVERAASQVRSRTTYARTHSLGVVDYVAVAMGHELPEADYRW